MRSIDDKFQRITNAAAAIRAQYSGQIKAGIILGTGLGQLVDLLDREIVIPYSEIPGMGTPTVESHQGMLHIGKLGGIQVMVFQGRFHHYEGHSMETITLPIRIMQMLGIQHLLISNAAGGLNPDYQRGDLMILKDHINLLPENPLRGIHDPRLGVRFPDMLDPYNTSLIRKGIEWSLENEVRLHEGVYAVVTGPNLETRAEYQYLRTIGGDAVGMSTVPEVIVARQAGMNVFAVSVITDLCYEPALGHVTLEEILKAAEGAQPHMTRLFISILKFIDGQ